MMFVSAVCVFLIGSAVAILAAVNPAGDSSNTVTFFVVGDWGREGIENQTKVAQLMADVGSKHRVPDFIVSTGDNFYPNGLNSTSDPLFDRSYRQVYNQPELQVPWYAVLGNHDYGDGLEYCEADDTKEDCERSPVHQLGTELVQRDWRWFCQRQYKLSFDSAGVDMFFIDTSPMILEYRDLDWAEYKGGLSVQSWESQLKEIEAQLKSSTATWKVMVGHHPPRSNGHHGNNSDVMQNLEPLLTTYNVQAYLAGHDHSLEHMRWSDLNTEYFVSGAGSECDRGFLGTSGSLYQYPWSGFIAVRISGSEMKVDYYNLEKGTRPSYSTSILM